MTVKFIGDLSNADVNLLIKLASNSLRILEFGVGGSTQLFAQFTEIHTTIVSIDTDKEWIARTIANLSRFEHNVNDVKFVDYTFWKSDTIDWKWFDLIFVDGVDDQRLPFALDAWPLLRVGGSMVFHDTRRSQDVANVLQVVARNYLEVSEVKFNTQGSNLSIIKKKVAEPWVNWNIVENKEPWEYGVGDPPEDFWRT